MGRIWESLLFSLEWRLYAYVITILFLWATTGHFAIAAIQALGLQLALFIGQTIWHFLRSGGYTPTLGGVSSWLATRIIRLLGLKRR